MVAPSKIFSKETISTLSAIVNNNLIKPIKDGVPQHFILKNILEPLNKFQKNHISVSGLKHNVPKFFNFLFDHSGETAKMLLVFNAISILSSHMNQIAGLAKKPLKKVDTKESKAELKTKRYLITQELTELCLDVALTIIPPFVLNNAISHKLYSGEWLNEITKKKIKKEIPKILPVDREELFVTAPRKSVSENVGVALAKLSGKIKDNEQLSKKFKYISDTIDKFNKYEVPKKQYKFKTKTLKEITAEYDQKVKELPTILRKEKQAMFRNGSAYDDVIGQIEGTKTLAAIAYTAVATAIVTPILKNIIANSLFKKENQASVNIQQSNTLKPVVNGSNIFNDFNSNVKPVTTVKQPQKQQLFSEFNTTYSGLNYSGRMKI